MMSRVAPSVLLSLLSLELVTLQRGTRTTLCIKIVRVQVTEESGQVLVVASVLPIARRHHLCRRRGRVVATTNIRKGEETKISCLEDIIPTYLILALCLSLLHKKDLDHSFF